MYMTYLYSHNEHILLITCAYNYTQVLFVLTQLAEHGKRK